MSEVGPITGHDRTSLTAHQSRNVPVFGKGSSLQTPVNTVVGWIAENIYDKGDSVRYAVDQTLGYTFPRTVQQLNRTRNITGERNKMAAVEMMIRDVAADVADTFLPGILATFGIGMALDKARQTLVRHNIPEESLRLYTGMLPHGCGTRAQFIQSLEESLTHAAGMTQSKPLDLTGVLERLRNNGSIHDEALQLASTLNLGDLDVKLSLKNGSETAKVLEAPLGEVLRDVSIIEQKVSRHVAHDSAQWGAQLHKVLNETSHLKHWQMGANLMALVASVSIPFMIRLITRHVYGEDAFPGTKELEKHFHTDESNPHSDPARRKFELFPYLKESLEDKKVGPLLMAAGFFSVLGLAVTHRFRSMGANIFKPHDWSRVYQFGREFPWTTVTQMELSYGLLCGIRLLASRDQAEYRETFIRDALLGWPTLTYFFPAFRSALVNYADKAPSITKFGIPNLLRKTNGDIRHKLEIAPQFFKAHAANPMLETALKHAQLYHSRITVASALSSIFLLAFAEPQVSIWVTNKLETKRLKEKLASLASKATAPLASMQAFWAQHPYYGYYRPVVKAGSPESSLVLNTKSPFLAFTSYELKWIQTQNRQQSTADAG